MSMYWNNNNGQYKTRAYDNNGYPFILTVDSTGKYSVVKLLIKSPHVPAQYARPMMMSFGTCADIETAKATAEKAFYNCTGIKPEVTAEAEPLEKKTITEDPAPVESTTATEETTDPVVEVEPKAETESIRPEVTVTYQVLEDKAEVTIEHSEGSVVRYTTSGKDVKTTNKIYSAPFKVDLGTIVKAVAYADGDNSVCSEQVEVEVN